MAAAEIAVNTALGLLHLLAERSTSADLCDSTATAVWHCWPPLKTAFLVANPVGTYLSAGLVVNRRVVQPGLGLAPLNDTPPYRYAPSIEAAGAALKFLLTRGWEPDAIAQRIGYEGEPALVARLAALPTDSVWLAQYPRGRKPPKAKSGEEA
jgi:hypothetical protein